MPMVSGVDRRGNRIRVGAALLLAGMVVIAGCEVSTTRRATAVAQPPQAAAGSYEIKGRIVSIARGGPSVNLAHEPIPGLMGAMTMSFPLRTPALAQGLSPGDSVAGQLTVDHGHMTLTELHRTGMPAHAQAGKANTKAQEPVRYFEFTGDVLAVRPDKTVATIHHDPIKGYMPLSMTMDFPVEPARVLDGIRPGDRVRGRIRVGADEGWVDRLERIGAARTPVKPDAEVGLEGEPVPIDAVVPDFQLTDQDNRPVSLNQFRGKAVVLTFIYTRCPFPQFCPLVTQQFQELQSLLRRRPGLRDRVQLLTISFDSAGDTPPRLKAYAVNHHADLAHWSFAVGPPQVIGRVASLFGLIYYPDSGQIAHTMRTAVIGPDGRLIELFKTNAWSPRQVVKLLTNVLPVEAARPSRPGP